MTGKFSSKKKGTPASPFVKSKFSEQKLKPLGVHSKTSSRVYNDNFNEGASFRSEKFQTPQKVKEGIVMNSLCSPRS